MKQPNDRHHPPRRTAELKQVSRMKATLFASGVGESAAGNTYTCTMRPEFRKEGQGSCPKCGMALEPLKVEAPKGKVEYTCPMHPEILRDRPGNCPVCGVALEPRTVTAVEDNAELTEMKRRFWTGVALTVPLLVIAMGDMVGLHLDRFVSPRALSWREGGDVILCC